MENFFQITENELVLPGVKGKHVFLHISDIHVACGPIIPCTTAREMHEASFDWIATQLEGWGAPTDRNLSSQVNS